MTRPLIFAAEAINASEGITVSNAVSTERKETELCPHRLRLNGLHGHIGHLPQRLAVGT